MDQWQYSNAPGAPRRFNSDGPPPQQASRYNGAAQPPTQAAYGYDQFQQGSNSHSSSMNPSPALQPTIRDGNGDIAMQDANTESYPAKTYPMRPHHSQHLSPGRGPTHTQGEQSSAAQRYSPMETLSPTSPYTSSPTINQNPYAAARQSPTRPGTYSSPGSYYSSRQQNQQLPPITPYPSNNEGYPPSATVQLNAVFGNNDPKSPRIRGPPQQAPTSGKGSVPQFQKVRSVSDLQPKINAQPAFRRANPEGGFISVGLFSRQCS